MSRSLDDLIKQSAHREHRSESTTAQVALAAIFGLIIAVATGQSFEDPIFWVALVASAIGGWLAWFNLHQQWLVPIPHKEVVEGDKALLTSSIISSHRSAYAISSNWLDLWRTSTFRYYLHLDAIMSLQAYSSNLISPIERLSTDEADQLAFFNYGWNLVKEIGEGKRPLRRHRLRLLIYPLSTYDVYDDEILQLIRSHSAARIPCIPLIAEELHGLLDPGERNQLDALVNALGQSAIDKLPPLSRWDSFHSRRAIDKHRILDYWPPVWPDLLLIDAMSEFATRKAWWYSSDGHVKQWGAGHATQRESASTVFQTICKHAEDAVWANYGPGSIGGVAVAATPSTLDSEAFFARPHYGEWLDWIKQNESTNTSARLLNDWLEAEFRIIDKAIAEYCSAYPDRVDSVSLIDLGCGTGRHLVSALRHNPKLRAEGVDINTPMITVGPSEAKKAGVSDRSNFLLGDASLLPDCGEGEYDLAICMTNTLGNLTVQKQIALARRVSQILRPGGRLLISAYSPASIPARMESYEAIGLHVEVRGAMIAASECLESEAFTDSRLRSLLEGNGLRVLNSIEPLAQVGWCVVAERPFADSSEHNLAAQQQSTGQAGDDQRGPHTVHRPPSLP